MSQTAFQDISLCSAVTPAKPFLFTLICCYESVQHCPMPNFFVWADHQLVQSDTSFRRLWSIQREPMQKNTITAYCMEIRGLQTDTS